MTDFGGKLRLKEMAEEDIFFAKRDRALIRALHEQELPELLQDQSGKQEKQAMALQDEYARVTEEHGSDPRTLAAHYRKLIEKALQLITG